MSSVTVKPEANPAIEKKSGDDDVIPETLDLSDD